MKIKPPLRAALPRCGTASRLRRALEVAAVGVLVCSAGTAFANIYSHTDERGVVTYSDRREHEGFRLLASDPAAAGGAGAPADTPVAAAPEAVRRPSSPALERQVAPVVARVARTHGLEPALLLALVQVESGFNPRARSHKGAQGLGQLMPATAARFGVRDPFDPDQNLEGAARYLSHLLALFGGDRQLALAAYNAGEAAVMRHGMRIPPYPETRRYVPAVLAEYQRRRGMPWVPRTGM